MIAALDGCENGFDSVQGLVSRHRPSRRAVANRDGALRIAG
jgi:hypothetical protein